MRKRHQQVLDPPATRGIVVAYVVMVIAVLVAFAAYFRDLAPLVLVVAVVLGALASVAAAVIVFRAGRRTGHGFWRCLWEAIKLPFDFVFSLP